jgi:hypothetical protein
MHSLGNEQIRELLTGHAVFPCRRLCGECTTLVENHDKIRCLSLAHRHVVQVSVIPV